MPRPLLASLATWTALLLSSTRRTMVSGACVESGPDHFKICLDSFEMALKQCVFEVVIARTTLRSK